MAKFIPLSEISDSSKQAIIPENEFLPDAYRLPEGSGRGPISPVQPRVVFIEVTNRCNLLCETCPRTFFDREPVRSLTLAEFVTIAEQFPEMQRALLHGIGEPLINRQLPEIIRYLKKRDVEVIINSNGTLLNEVRQKELIHSGLDQYRCSIDGARRETYASIRGADLLPKLIAGLGGLVAMKERLQSSTPRISIWIVASQKNVQELPDIIRLAHELGVSEVYVQRMVFFAQDHGDQFGQARQENAIFGNSSDQQEKILSQCEAISADLGITFRASGATDPRHSIAAARPADYSPWQACLRPWTTAYVTANGNCLPCCISPFATKDYSSLILGNLFNQKFSEIWEADAYQEFRSNLLTSHPHKACSSCGVYWSL